MDQIKHLLVTGLLALVAVTAAAQSPSGLSATQRVLGYTLTDSITSRGAYFGKAGTYPVGAVLEAGSLENYAGCKIVGIRFAVSQTIGRTRAFLYQIVDNTPEEVYSQNQRTYEGWNNVFFNGDGITIAGDEQLLFGFDYIETDAMVEAEEGALCLFGYEDVDNAFMAYGNFGSGLGFYTLSGGCLCVQLIVDVSNLPAHNMNVSYFDAGFKYKQPGETIEALARFVNVGREAVSTYQLGYQLDEQEPVLTDFTSSLPSARDTTWEFKVPLPDDIVIGNHRLAVFVNTIEGEAASGKGKREETSFAVYRDVVDRSQVYMEIYSNQASPYVPYLDQAVSLLQQQTPYLCVTNVFNATSSLGISEAAYLCDLYAYTYPTFTSNRAYFPGEAYIAYDMNYYLPSVPSDMIAAILGDIVYQDLYSPSFATVGLSAEYDAATRELTVRADGQLLPEAEAIYGDVALTLLLTEDSVVARQAVYNEMLGRTSYDNSYMHHNVLRGYMTDAKGDKLTAEDRHYDVLYATVVPEKWNPANLHVVALLTKAADEITDDNVLEMDIINCNSLALAPIIAQGIETIQHSPFNIHHSAFFSLDGKRVDASSVKPGIYIVRGTDGKSKKIVVR